MDELHQNEDKRNKINALLNANTHSTKGHVVNQELNNDVDQEEDNKKFKL